MNKRIFVGVIASLIVLSVAWATTAQAEGEATAAHVNATAMGQSLHAQLAGQAHAYEFALVQNDQLELTGHSDGISPSGAIAMAQSTAFGGDERFCHITIGDIEASLIVEEPADALPQPCALLGAAFEAAA